MTLIDMLIKVIELYNEPLSEEGITYKKLIDSGFDRLTSSD